jgi:putative transposase
MKHHNIVLHQLLNFLPRPAFQAVVDRHNGDYRTRTLSCWDQLVSLLFCQLSGVSLPKTQYALIFLTFPTAGG